MDNSVIIKGYKDGMILQLSPDLPFPELEEKIRAKFTTSAKFLGNAKMAITFKDRVLSQEEQKRILGIISEVTELEVLCVFDNDEENEEILKKSVDDVIGSLSDLSGRVFRGVLPSGKTLEAETSLIIVGNVEKGAVVKSGGSVTILGALKGTVHAGTNFNKDSYVYASILEPEEITINGILYEPEPEPKKRRHLFGRKEQPVKLPKLVTRVEDSLMSETVTEDTFFDSGELMEFM